jgi:hypothetical protein
LLAHVHEVSIPPSGELLLASLCSLVAPNAHSSRPEHRFLKNGRLRRLEAIIIIVLITH